MKNTEDLQEKSINYRRSQPSRLFWFISPSAFGSELFSSFIIYTSSLCYADHSKILLIWPEMRYFFWLPWTMFEPRMESPVFADQNSNDWSKYGLISDVENRHPTNGPIGFHWRQRSSYSYLADILTIWFSGPLLPTLQLNIQFLRIIYSFFYFRNDTSREPTNCRHKIERIAP